MKTILASSRDFFMESGGNTMNKYDFYDGVRILKDKTKTPIGIEWRTDKGSTRYYPSDISEKWFAEFCNMVREEKNMRLRIYRHCAYFDTDEFDWLFSCSDEDVTNQIRYDDEANFVQTLMNKLTEEEKVILQLRMDNPRLTVRDLAKKMLTSKSGVHRRLQSIAKKYESLRMD